MNTEKQRGFTILELLIVIVIIGILATLVITMFGNASAKARDTVRRADFKQFSTSLQVYYETYGAFPCGDANLAGGYTQDGSASDPFLDGLPVANCDTSYAPYTGLYTEKLFPDSWRHDPVNKPGSYMYWYIASPDRQSYVLYSRLEKDDKSMQSDNGECDNFYEVRGGADWIPLLMTSAPYAFGVECDSSFFN